MFGPGQVVRRGDHAIGSFQAEDVHLPGAEPPGGEGAVEGDAAAAEDDHFLSDLPDETEIDLSQEFDPFDPPVGMGDSDFPFFPGPDGNQNGII